MGFLRITLINAVERFILIIFFTSEKTYYKTEKNNKTDP